MLIQPANHGFGLSTDAFLTSVKKFLDKKVRTIYHLTAARVPHHTPVTCYVLFHDATSVGSQIGLYLWNRLPDYFATAREVYK